MPTLTLIHGGKREQTQEQEPTESLDIHHFNDCLVQLRKIFRENDLDSPQLPQDPRYQEQQKGNPQRNIIPILRFTDQELIYAVNDSNLELWQKYPWFYFYLAITHRIKFKQLSMP